MTEPSLIILRFLAEGCTVEEVFWHYPSLDYGHIRQAAQEALNSLTTPTEQEKGIERTKSRYPKAFTRWTDEEQDLLAREFQAGNSVKALSELLNRQPGAIRIRLEKLGLLVPDDTRRKRFPL